MGNHWPQRTRPVPDDFTTWAKVEGTKKLQVRYGTSQSTVERWRRQTGIGYAVPNAPRAKAAVAKARRRIVRRMAAERIEELTENDPWSPYSEFGVRRYFGGCE